MAAARTTAGAAGYRPTKKKKTKRNDISIPRNVASGGRCTNTNKRETARRLAGKSSGNIDKESSFRDDVREEECNGVRGRG